VLSVTLGVPLLNACILPSQHKKQELSITAARFASDLRWGRYRQAAASLVPEEQDYFMKRAELLRDNLVVADEEITALSLQEGGDKAILQMRMRWYTHNQPVVRSTVVEQLWVLQGPRWLLSSQHRAGGDRFPLVREPARQEPAASDTRTDTPPNRPEASAPVNTAP